MSLPAPSLPNLVCLFIRAHVHGCTCQYMHMHNGRMCPEMIRTHGFLLIVDTDCGSATCQQISRHNPLVLYRVLFQMLQGDRKEPDGFYDHRPFVIQSSVTVADTSWQMI